MAGFVRPEQGHVILFKHWKFHGEHHHVFRDAEVLWDRSSPPDPWSFDNITSSIIVLEGTWEFFKEDNYVNIIGELGPGQYPNIIELWGSVEVNDAISSLKLKPCDPISW